TREGRVEGVQRVYNPSTRATSRAAVTDEIALARLWRVAADPYLGWSAIVDAAGPDGTAPAVARALILDARLDEHRAEFTRRMIERWGYPGAAFDGVYEYEPGVWLHESVEVPERTRFVAPVWIGAGRVMHADDTVVGPGIAPDAPGAAFEPGELDWPEMLSVGAARRRAWSRRRVRVGKRAFDILFSLAVLAATAPLYPIIALAIFVEDGWPPFFAHRRQTLRGREFPCIKFRTMRRNADSTKAQLAAMKQAD